ncbi:MAG: HAMP domain-containing protein, partial [Leptospiraceae bacterium]|nr:HAMP domain-containing protein [Leptospiraceae bacterium]
LCRQIQYLVKDGSVLFLYARDHEDEAERFAAMFMLTLKSMRSIEPDYAIRYITGRSEVSDEDRLIYEFKHFLDPGYEVPEFVHDDFDNTELRTSVDEAVTRSESRPEVAHADGNGHHPQHAGDVVSSSTGAGDTIATEILETTAAPVSDHLDADHTASTQSVESKAEESTTTDSSQDTVFASDSSAATVAKPTANPPAPVAPAQKPKSESGDIFGDDGARSISDFKQSRFTIRVKLLGIITAIIVLSLGTMIFFASQFFREDSEARIQENNLNLARVIGQRVESEVENINYKVHLIALTVEQGLGTAEKTRTFTDLFFDRNKEFIFVGIADQVGNDLVFRRNLYNLDLLETQGITPETISEWHELNKDAFMKSFGGAFIIHNASHDAPLLGVSLPLGDVTRNSIIVAYLEPSAFLKSFQTSGIVKTFMVNQEGDVIAHEDSQIVLARENMINVPIVQEMIQSPNDNGNIRFDWQDDTFMGSFQKLKLGGLGVISQVREEQALQAVYNIQFWNLMIMGIVMAIAFLIVYFFAKTMTVPIVELVGATQSIESGQYDITIEPMTRDEIGRLTHSFSNMAGGLAERERIKDAMVKFVNKQVAELALKGEIKLGGEAKEVAVFFSDLRGFTAMSEGMTPEEVVGYLNEYFTGMVDCVNKTHGIVDKFIGDAVMAHWGAFGSEGNDTENAINGALMMRQAIIEFNKRGAGNRPFAKMGCGINTGQVVSGQIGSEERFEFTVIGDAVNLASRIEALNKPFGTDILVSQDSYDKVKDLFKVEPMPAIKVKG